MFTIARLILTLLGADFTDLTDWSTLLNERDRHDPIDSIIDVLESVTGALEEASDLHAFFPDICLPCAAPESLIDSLHRTIDWYAGPMFPLSFKGAQL